MNYLIDLKEILFLRQLKKHPDQQLLQVLSCFVFSDALELKYLIESNEASRKLKYKLFNPFKTVLAVSMWLTSYDPLLVKFLVLFFLV